MSFIIDGTLGATFNDGSLQAAAASPYVLKNRIINGAMVIDQRNAGASTTPAASGPAYLLDRWLYYNVQVSKLTYQQNYGSVTPPAGFSNYFGVYVASAYTPTGTDEFDIIQRIEGFNTADLDFGKSTAKTITLSFWVRSSLTGTFGGSIVNGAGNRSYPFSYTINSTNTWEQKTVTIVGDTTGTWIGATNGIGMQLVFSMGAGSSSLGTAGAWTGSGVSGPTGQTNIVANAAATWYVTGVQLEQNTSATPFERRLYNQELANCQRYFNTSYFGSGSAVGTATTTNQVAWIAQSTGNYNGIALTLPVQMRVAPAITTYSGLNGASGNMNALTVTISASALTASTTSFNVFANNVSTTYSSNLYFHYTASSEL